MIDINCHILDGVGCGPETFEESLEMCRMAVDGGVRTILATILWNAGETKPPVPFEVIDGKIERLRREIRGLITLMFGVAFEFRVDLPDLVCRYGASVTLAGKRHVMVVLPSTLVPVETSQVWTALAEQGHSPIIAHPERSPALRRNLSLLSDWVAQGVKLQLDAASVAGRYGRDVQKTTFQYLERFEGHVVVASNARSQHSTALDKTRAQLVDKLGERRARNSTHEVPYDIISEEKPSLHNLKTAKRGMTALIGSLRPLRDFIS